jgi:predicted PurR-regulated permease PerM
VLGVKPGTRDAHHISVGRKLTMLATIFVVPGGLMLLAAVALVILVARTQSGQRLLAGIKRRVPPRVRARARRVLALTRAEKLFLPTANSVHSA